MRPLKVLFVINGLGTGGAERSLAEMLPGFVQSGIRPIVACLNPRQEGVEAAVRGQGFDVRVLPGSQGHTQLGALRMRIAAIRQILRTERPDVVHTTHFESDIAGRLAARGRPARVISSLVNTSYDGTRRADPDVPRLRLAAVQAIDGWTARHLNEHFHAITNAVKQAAVEALGLQPERITVVERGRDPGRLGGPSEHRRLLARKRLGLDDRAEVLINVGRQEFQKGQWLLLEAMKSLVATRPNIVLLVAGRAGHLTARLERLHGLLGLDDRVRLLGHRDDVPELLAAADLFVFPSLYEGLGGALLEAMALGLPVVATDLEVTREVVDEGRSALLFPKESIEGLTTAVTSLLEDRGRARRFGERGRAIFEERFTLERSTERMVELYKRVALSRVTARDAAIRPDIASTAPVPGGSDH
jgi:glycosyltransferase involved in cell wall biosynthesis